KFADLRARLNADAIGTLAWPANPWLAVDSIVDNVETARVRRFGEWTVSTADAGRYGANYLHDGNTGKGEKFVLFKPVTTITGDYTVSLWNSISTSRATNAPVWVFTNDMRLAAAPNAYAHSAASGTHFGGSEFLVGRAPSTDYHRGYLRFDLSSLPAAALLDSVTLTLTIKEPDTGSDNATAGAAGLTVHALTEPFDPATVTWNSRASGEAWSTPGGAFVSNAVTAIASPPFFGDVTPGMVFTFPTSNLFAMVQNIHTNDSADKSIYLVVRAPDLEKSYASRKLYRFSEARLDVVWADPSVPPTTRVNLKVDTGMWRDIGTFPVGAGGIRVMIGNNDTTAYVTADAVRVTCVRSDIDPDDYDGNGLPNAWERRWFMQETGTDPQGDPDGDGKTNLEEYQDNTNPLDPRSRREIGTRVILTQAGE
ncbi:MAG: DNRLRE domain-containing protein, partial [Verrucomicrobiota bacterium]|nr:DNRLRE domain-containing protein [Verrucomicrobiota bacterium]